MHPSILKNRILGTPKNSVYVNTKNKDLGTPKSSVYINVKMTYKMHQKIVYI